MTIRKTLSRAIIGATLIAAGFAPSSANASVSASGTTNMNVTVPEYIVLRYYSNINLAFTASSSSSASGDKAFEATWSGSDGVAFNAEIAAPEAISPATRKVTLSNVWSVAGLSPSGTASVAIEGSNLTQGSGEALSTIGVKDWKVSTSTVSAASSITTTLRGISGGATTGNVSMTLDFSETTRSGAHTGTFTITAETI
ncbi:hypothetical protein [Chlorobium sp. N1]|uniref:hypothetical protein n=1 Tax=Chlorobium sp. N1 TaxID=2491138 RepID=UPI001040170A|nr:hypothetical protein [Chlorobium sp. N1]TCD47424.1 hypothetical protein E0L29_07725 [Chlorobium sp. N1]